MTPPPQSPVVPVVRPADDAPRHMTASALVALLRARGLIITNPDLAEEYLGRVGYYRLSGYCESFLRPDDPAAFVAGASFQDVVALYLFDKRLRLTALDALERVEVAVRAGVADILGARDPLAHRRAELLRPGRAAEHAEWLTKRATSIARARETLTPRPRREDRENREDRDEPPIWAAAELWSFGDLFNFCRMMQAADQRALAVRFGAGNEHIFVSWLRAMKFIRNVSAHHDRLWNRPMIGWPTIPAQRRLPGFNPPLLPSGRNGPSVNRIYATLCVMAFMLRQICPRSGWPARLRAFLLADFPKAPGRKLIEMGFPPEWENSPFWRT